MANTTNFGWETPDDTDLVKDGAAAMRTLGNAIDTSFLDLKGGTTNQILAKNSNTDLDFKWVSDATGIPATIFDAKGDIIAATAADTADRLAVGANDTVLTAASGEATGLKWATPSVTDSLTLLNSGGTALTGATTITVNLASSYNNLFVRVDGASSANASSIIRMRFNADTAANYGYCSLESYSGANVAADYDVASTYVNCARMGNSAANTVSFMGIVLGAKGTGFKTYTLHAAATGSTTEFIGSRTGFYAGTSAITSVSIVSSTGNFDAGTVYVYGG